MNISKNNLLNLLNNLDQVNMIDLNTNEVFTNKDFYVDEESDRMLSIYDIDGEDIDVNLEEESFKIDPTRNLIILDESVGIFYIHVDDGDDDGDYIDDDIDNSEYGECCEDDEPSDDEDLSDVKSNFDGFSLRRF